MEEEEEDGEGGQEADLQGRPDFGPQHEAPFLFPSHQGAPSRWRSLWSLSRSVTYIRKLNQGLKGIT